MKANEPKMGMRVRVTRGAWSGCEGTVIGKRDDSVVKLWPWVVHIDPKAAGGNTALNLPFDADELDDITKYETLGAPSAPKP